MDEQMDNRQLFLLETGRCIKRLRDFLRVQNPAPQQLTALAQAVESFRQIAAGEEVGSFQSIGSRLQAVFLRHSTAQTLPSRIELEAIELAVDWLAELSTLYEETLPEPKALVSELLYTFDLLERSQDAATLTELLANHTEQGARRVDPFLEDPDLAIETYPVTFRLDPFAEDPGFGMEFDLLQKTIGVAAEKKRLVEDPFSADPSLNIECDKAIDPETVSATLNPPYDLFAGDPPLSGDLDDKG